jgi:hypothetical protein
MGKSWSVGTALFPEFPYFLSGGNGTSPRKSSGFILSGDVFFASKSGKDKLNHVSRWTLPV